MNKPITETVTVTRPVSSTIADLIQFARGLNATPEQLADDAWMVKAADEYWDRQHGED